MLNSTLFKVLIKVKCIESDRGGECEGRGMWWRVRGEGGLGSNRGSREELEIDGGGREGRGGGGGEWCGVKKEGGAELTHLGLSSPMSVHVCWPLFVSCGGIVGWWWSAHVMVHG